MCILGGVIVGFFQSSLFYTSVLKHCYQVDDNDDIFSNDARLSKDNDRPFSARLSPQGTQIEGHGS
jgi:hypothetical protein